MKIIAQNKKAYAEYHVLETLEAGLVLTGDEVKAIRAGHLNLTGSFVTVHKDELFLLNAHVSPYSHAYQKSDEHTRRNRKLLVHKREFNMLLGQVSRKGVTLIPLKVYFNKKNYIKVEIGLCKHKKLHDRKQELRERDINRETNREIRGKGEY